FTFEKFPQADPTLTTQMKSVGEAMAIGRTFKEALQKALRSLEIKRFGLCGDGADNRVDLETLRLKLSVPNAERIFHLAQAFQDGMSIDEVFDLTKIDRWFLRNVAQIVKEASALRRGTGFQPVGQVGVSPAIDSEGQMPTRPADNKISAPRFRAFDPHGELRHRKRNLPHSEQAGATYFVTFRLADAVPQNLLRQWKQELETWLEFHPDPWDTATKYEYQKRFQEERERWLDQGHGECLFKQAAVATVIANSLRHFDSQRYVLDAFVIMPNHVHVLVQPTDSHSLAAILHSWKSFSAKEINRLLGRDGTVWQDENYDRIVRDFDELAHYRSYIARNPAQAQLRAC